MPGGFALHSAEAVVTAGDADLVAFGRRFISNPDLPERLRRGLPLNRYDRSTFYGGDARLHRLPGGRGRVGGLIGTLVSNLG